MGIKIYNTLTRKKEKFVPRESGKVGLYACGPTVYNYAHIGNFRYFITVDILRRVLLSNKFKLKHVMNITDVGHLTSDADEGEDKMAKGARREKKSVWDIAEYYTKAFLDDSKKLNIQRPDILCKATDHIKDMIEMNKKIEANGFTYVSGGNLYYDVSKCSDYGKLANLNLEEQKAGASVDVDSDKRNPQDFVLWFTKSKFGNQDMQWDSPWGKGFPGWHIECSAMSSTYLGDQFDIHTGGIDHIPVHHTNEIAQAEAASGKKPWVKYWMHQEFLVMDKGKMTKSGDSFVTVRTLEEKGFDPLVYRYFVFTAHYRSPLNFSWDILENAGNSFDKLKKKVVELKNDASSNSNAKLEKEYKTRFMDYLNDDLDVPKALAVLWEVVKDKELGGQQKYNLLLWFDKIFGFGFDDWEEKVHDVSAEVEKLIKEREEARKAKDFAKADEIRDDLKAKRIILEDSKDGVKWRRS